MIKSAAAPSTHDELRSDIHPTVWDVNGGPDAESFRAAMRRVIGGVTVITTRHDGRPWGLTVSAFTPVCMDPPTILICVNSRTVTASDISRDSRFAVNLLSQTQLHLSKLCSRAGEDKFLDGHVLPQSSLPERVTMPVLRDSILTFDCTASDVRRVGSHLVVIAAIEGVLASQSHRPLLYGEGRYLRGVALDDASICQGAGA
ncbi:flavin reductase family protein [Bradyrhizobium sp. SSUT18]|uniref:flavin reductase family protein n=1 Tax=Bradyrhizobium sp. SSUT18 TaxID=3040602 RepID=UPI00244A1AF5|nr:flavin reductase family protein [Bradyrhizobium sp. SSUT18]MDH2398747.1 flavin reductase family protein [Bradyrhizobium sp. SSUT18]